LWISDCACPAKGGGIAEFGFRISDCAWPPTEKAGQAAKGSMIADQTALLRLVNRKQAFLSTCLRQAGFLLLAFNF